MKYISIIAILFATTASADSSVKGNVVDYYNNVVVSTPHEKRLCEEYQVPIYGQQGSARRWRCSYGNDHRWSHG
jgi:hypothetical protein